jgi:cytochrome P450
MGTMFRFLAEDPELQATLRNDRSLVPNFVEELLRLEGTVKTGFRLPKVATKIGDLDVAPGTPVMLCISAMSRDPSKFENPDQFQMGRANAREHLAFGRGIHSCIGAPLARAELIVSLESMFNRLDAITINEAKHGPASNRNFEYIPSYSVRGLTEVHLTFAPKAN